MKRNLVSATLLAVGLTAGACTQFEGSREVLSPSSPSPLPGGSSEGPMVGPWVAPTDLTLPSPETCRNFQWQITSQSPTAVAGTFTAECGGGLAISASASGTLTSATTVALTVTGNGVIGILGCPFDLTSNATIVDDYTLDVPYTGTTCFGPVSGHQTLRRPRPEAPAPEPLPNVDAGPSPYHVGPGPLSADRAHQVLEATAAEFPHLTAPRGSVGEKIGATEELLLRIIWHLHQAGYQAGRQRNPSGAISNDKMTILVDGGWHAYDIFTNFDVAGASTRIIFIEVWPPNHLPEGGIPD
jgi:hypothetical protein